MIYAIIDKLVLFKVDEFAHLSSFGEGTLDEF